MGYITGHMNTQGAGKTLPIILAALTLATAAFFWSQREALRSKTQELLDRTKLVSTKLPEPTPFIPVKQNQAVSPTPTVTPTALPTTVENKTVTGATVKKTTATTKTQTTRTVTVCTPVYGMANSCAEHVVVDTALDTSVFYNLAGLSYFAVLAAFIKAKKRA